ncbi:filamentous hemagglutinin family protein [Rhodopseudomonas rhenobacensis]|uniref:Filamentous hemagglutinin family protein n=1 Tax=Rhodopseudomonas rhenobacensis TaxID=87461 RepID=A0A7W8DZZ8_9BRAD|nr:GLUG motif-containing protein [Rhodopseudomonas rhenobacensis]MBB5048425.1 filamentous hemagglutinin family protein [Rhodopseudomonas rhenobacensis]
MRRASPCPASNSAPGVERLRAAPPYSEFDVRRRLTLAILLASTALTTSFVPGQARAQNLPVGGSVAAGGAAIATPSATQLNITQTTPSAVINWQSFSVGQGSAVAIQQPNAASALLNRVTGATPSTIAGSITANGQVYLVNPNGIAITRSGTVDTGGGFVASTLGISDADFQSGKRGFTGNGASAAVSNAGAIRVGRGGFAALLGGTVSNAGSIDVPLGKVGLGSGESATLDFSGDGFLQVAVPTTAGGKAALIRSSGSIKADGGSVIISAATAREAARNAVNISGLVQARSIGGHNGAIVIGGGAGGRVKISGRLDASSHRHNGGAIVVTGKDIKLKGASVDASGRTGGGSINIGGGRQGQGALQRAETVSIDAGSAINANAGTTGNGGNVTVWSDRLTSFAGTISAKGGAQSGHGGEAEVSGKAVLDYTGFTDLSAAQGAFGTLLLDPYNVTISTGSNNTGGGFIGSVDDSIINAATLQTALGAAHVAVTTGSGGAQAGHITVASPLSWSAGTTLTLTAAGGIVINAPISITGAGGLVLTATAQAGISSTGLSFGGGASVSYGATDNGGSFSLNGTVYKLVYTMAQLDAIDGVNAVNGGALTTYGTGVTGSYALANDLIATGTTYTMALIGTNSSDSSASRFRGNLDGLGHSITGLTIDAPGSDYVGLIGYKVGRNVSNIGLVDASVSGYDRVGALIGYDDSASVQGSSVTGTVSGHENVGGLVGLSFTSPVQSSYSTATVTGVNNTGGLVGQTNFGSRLINAYATGAVTGTGDNTGGLVGNNSGGTTDTSYATGTVSGLNNTGGLAGYNNQIIQNSHASGNVTGGDSTGGLVGLNAGTLTATYASGTVGGDGNTGGLVGYNQLTVQDSYATGAVTGNTRTGGLIGADNFGALSILNSYATGAVTGTGDATGGLIGDHSSGTVDGSYATGAVSGVNKVGGLVGYSTQTIQNSHASGTVTGADNTGGLVGNNEGTVDGSFASGAITGTDSTGGLVGYSNNTSIVQNSYATGTVSGVNNTGGLIGATNFGTPTVQNSYATGAVTGSGDNTGGLVGGAGGGTIDGSHATGAVSGANYVGGLVGNSTEAITDSYATGSVTGTADNVGGLVGYNDGGSIDASNASGVVIGINSVGGLVGASNASIQNSSATGAVSGANSIGGLVGNNSGAVTNSFAAGAVTATGDNTGGLIGYNDVGTIDRSYASGIVVGVNNVGGLVGYGNALIQSSYATGAVTGTGDNTGGLIGNNEGTVDASYATGVTIGLNSTGGLVGISTAASVVQNSHATGAVFGANNTGGLIGATNFGTPTVQNSYATGTVTGSADNTGGLVGGASGGTIVDSHASGAVVGVNFVGGLVGQNNQTIQTSYATGTVSGSFATGGLAGYNNGTIDGGYASGAVTGGDVTGGLVGYNDNPGTVQNSYAVGAVLGNDTAGGLIGTNNYGATVRTSYATGAVSAGANAGGVVGFNDGSVTDTFWDTLTSGRSVGIAAGGDLTGVTGLTTAQLQGTTTATLGAAFSGGAASGTAGLYPYLVSLFPGGVQAISGIAYQDAGSTVAASGANGAVQVGLTVGGVAQAPVTTGANGYYYFAVPMGSISSAGTLVLTTTAADVATGAQNGAAIARATGTTTGLDILGGSSNFVTSALTYSAAGFASVLGFASTPAFVATLPAMLSATGVSFTLDQPLTITSALTVRTTASNAALIVSAPITLAGANSLTLAAAGALTINAPISVTGAGAVVLTAAAQAGLTTTGLSFGNGASIDYGATDNGGTFMLNGAAYTLAYTMAQLDAIDGRNAVNGTALTVYGAGVTGNYALATNLIATGTTYTRAVIADFPTFNVANAYSGKLDGLGHTVTGLTINAGSRDQVGLVGFLLDGTVSNIGLVGGSISGRSNIGGVVGNVSTAISTLQGSYSTGSVASTGSGNSTGGVAGGNNGVVQSSYATGAVSGKLYVGGLVGYNLNTITSSFATGQVTGTVNTGGLVGLSTGTITDSYATGTVRGGDQVGGLLGTNSLGGAVQTSYSTGMVSGTSNVGGLIGSNYSSVTSSYWDADTSGRSNGMGSDSQNQSANVTGLTTAQLQSGSLPAGFGSVWRTGAGLYPYLSWQFVAGSSPQAVSGMAYQAGGAALAGALVGGTVNGAAFAGGAVSTGANGYYYAVMPQGAIAAGSDVFTYVAGNTVKANAFVQGATGAVQNLDLRGGTLSVATDASTLSAVAAGLAGAVGATATGDLVFGTPGGVLTPNAATELSIAASGAFSIDQLLTVSNTLLITSAGSLGIASGGKVSSSNGDATLVAGTSFVNSRGADALSAATGRWLVYSGDPGADDRGGLAYDFKQYAASYGVTAVAQATGNGFLYSVAPVLTAALTGSVTKTYDGNLTATLASSNLTATGLIDGDIVTYSSPGTAGYTTPNAGTGLTVTTTGLGVASISNGSAAVYGYVLPGTTASGNVGTIAARAVTLSGTQTYSGTTAAPAAGLTVDNLVMGDNAGLSGVGTMASANAGAQVLTSAGGALAGLSVSNANYTVTGGSGIVTVTPADITVTALGGSSVYGTSPANPGLAASGLQNGESVAVLGGLFNSFGITNTSGVASSPYTLTVAGTSSNANYTIVARNSGIWTVTPAAVTVTALGGSSVYGTSPANPGLAASGLQNGESIAVLGGLFNSFGITSTSSVAQSPYTLTVAGALSNPNYTLAARIDGSWIVTAADAPSPPAPPPPSPPSPSPVLSSDPAPFASTLGNGNPPWPATGFDVGVRTLGSGDATAEPCTPPSSSRSVPPGCRVFYADKRFGR